MEYMKLTDGQITVVVVDQDNKELTAWPYAIKMKTGKSHFKLINSTTSLKSAMTDALYMFQQECSRHEYQA
jgi:hypothetical protein